LHAVKFNTTLAYLESTHPWDDGPYRPFWEAVAALDVPVFFTLGAGPELGYRPDQQQGYLNELHVLMRWMDRYGETACSITHGFPWRVFFDGAHMTLPDAIWTPFENPNLSLEVCFPVRLGDLVDFPYKEIWPTLAEMVEHIGADRLLWGTDMPFQNRFCTYRQSRDWIEKYDHGLSQDDLAMIMGGTAGRILKIGD
jgi:predicted TIM-barrel fold metal-dependent hydrolase